MKISFLSDPCLRGGMLDKLHFDFKCSTSSAHYKDAGRKVLMKTIEPSELQIVN